MENVIIPISDLPTCDAAYKAFKVAVGRVIAKHEGHPIELSRSTSALYARVPTGKVDVIRSEVSALKL